MSLIVNILMNNFPFNKQYSVQERKETGAKKQKRRGLMMKSYITDIQVKLNRLFREQDTSFSHEGNRQRAIKKDIKGTGDVSLYIAQHEVIPPVLSIQYPVPKERPKKKNHLKEKV